MTKNIVITHGYSDSNKGDLAITEATYLGLKKNNPEAKITLLSTFRQSDPDFWYHNRKMKEKDIVIKQGILPTPYIGHSTSQMDNVIAVLRLAKDYCQLRISMISDFLGRLFGGHQYKALKIIKDADLVIVKGGQFIYNDREDLRGNLFLWRTLYPIRIATGLNKKTIVLGQSIGGFAGQKSIKYTIKHLKNCSKFVVREQLTYDLLKTNGIDNIYLKPDMAFYINKSKADGHPISSRERSVMGVTVVNWPFPDNLEPIKARENYVNNLVEGIHSAYSKYGLKPFFIPQVTVRHHGKSDLDLIEEIRQKLQLRNVPSDTTAEDLSVDEIVKLYAKCKFLIGTRLHSCILAAVSGIPVIAIRYQGFKTQGVMKMLGFEDFVHDINTLRSEELISSIKTMMGDYNSYKHGIINKVEQLKEELETVFQEL